jgi:hypothetical protein
MSKAFFAAVAVLLLLMAPLTTTVCAQSYESRGYGGPLYIGPNFQQGGQHAPPVYNSGPSRSRSYDDGDGEATSKRRATRSHKQRKPETTTAKKSKPVEPAPEKPAKSEAKPTDTAAIEPKTKTRIEGENSSLTRASDIKSTAEASPAKPVPSKRASEDSGKGVGCKKYFPSAGMTLTVPCE